MNVGLGPSVRACRSAFEGLARVRTSGRATTSSSRGVDAPGNVGGKPALGGAGARPGENGEIEGGGAASGSGGSCPGAATDPSSAPRDENVTIKIATLNDDIAPPPRLSRGAFLALLELRSVDGHLRGDLFTRL
jgi:hypothetical protein